MITETVSISAYVRNHADTSAGNLLGDQVLTAIFINHSKYRSDCYGEEWKAKSIFCYVLFVLERKYFQQSNGQ